jgi:hypothetical protein
MKSIAAMDAKDAKDAKGLKIQMGIAFPWRGFSELQQ